MRSIEWFHFQWPWMTPNPDFKVTPLFDAEWVNVSETIRDRDSYNVILTGTYIRPTQSYHFEWPWVIFEWLSKYSMTWIHARPVCDSWASCFEVWAIKITICLFVMYRMRSYCFILLNVVMVIMTSVVTSDDDACSLYGMSLSADVH